MAKGRSWIAAAAALFTSVAAQAQERVSLPSLDGTTLTGWLYRSDWDGRRPALVFLHGCSGLGREGRPSALYRAWATILQGRGYSVLMVDSATPRGFGQACTPGPERLTAWSARPKDAYGALLYLQSQDFVRPDRVAVLGWSQGGGVVLLSVGRRSSGRPAGFPGPDFRAGIAFYPGACSERLQSRPFVEAEPNSWTTEVPLLVLQGEADNWTKAEPCCAFIAGAKERGAPVTFVSYPGAEHGFDAPRTPRREIAAYRQANGFVPVIGTDPAARQDALDKVPAFLSRYLDD